MKRESFATSRIIATYIICVICPISGTCCNPFLIVLLIWVSFSWLFFPSLYNNNKMTKGTAVWSLCTIINNKQRHYKGVKLHLLQERQCVCLRWQPLRRSYCGQLVGTSGLQLGRLVKVDCIKLVTVAMLGPSIGFTTSQVLSRWG